MSNETIRRIYEESVTGYLGKGKGKPETNELGRALVQIVGPGKHVLDIGAGTGLCLVPLRELGGTSVGVEISKTAVERCRAKGFTMLELDIENDAIDELKSKGPYDAVIMADVLEHLLDPLAVLKDKVLPLLKPGGRVIATVPNFVYLRYRLELLSGNISHFNNDDATGHDLPRPYNLGHKTMFNRSNLRETFRLAGFSKISVEPELFAESFSPFWSKPLLRGLRDGIKRLWPTLLAARFLVMAEKPR